MVKPIWKPEALLTLTRLELYPPIDPVDQSRVSNSRESASPHVLARVADARLD